MVEYLKFTPKTANNWARAWQETQRERPWAFPRVIDSFTESIHEKRYLQVRRVTPIFPIFIITFNHWIFINIPFFIVAMF